MENKILFKSKLRVVNDKIFITAKYFDETYNFIVDSCGIKNTLYWETHKALAEKNGFKAEAYITLKNTTLFFDFGAPNVPKMDFLPQSEFNSNQFRKGMNGLICPQNLVEDGYIIYNFKSNNLIGFDGTEKEVQNLFPKETFYSTPFTYETEWKFPVIYASTKSQPDIKYPYLLDTGASITVMPSDSIQKNKITHKTSVMVFADSTEVQHKVAKDVIVKIGKHMSELISVHSYDGNHPKLSKEILQNGESAKGLLNIAVFKNKIIAIPCKDALPILISK